MKFVANCDNVTRIEREDLTEEFKLYNEKNRSGETNTLKIKAEGIKNLLGEFVKTNFLLLDDTGRPEIYVAKRKPTQYVVQP